jgi:hypothetical protein
MCVYATYVATKSKQQENLSKKPNEMIRESQKKSLRGEENGIPNRFWKKVRSTFLQLPTMNLNTDNNDLEYQAK